VARHRRRARDRRAREVVHEQSAFDPPALERDPERVFDVVGVARREHGEVAAREQFAMRAVACFGSSEVPAVREPDVEIERGAVVAHAAIVGTPAFKYSETSGRGSRRYCATVGLSWRTGARVRHGGPVLP